MNCYSYENYHFENPLLPVNATYIIHLEGNGRYDTIIESMQKFPTSKNVHILLNKGYKKCNKPNIKSSVFDLIDANLNVMKHAYDNNYECILVLEDDFIFDEKIKEKKHKDVISTFLKKHKEPIFYRIGCLPSYLIPYDNYNYKGLVLGTHAVIYNRSAIKEMLHDNKLVDWDVYINSKNQFIYYLPLCYQLFSETENSKIWGIHSYFTYIFCIIIKKIIRWCNLDTSTYAYPFFYFSAKILPILLLLFLYYQIIK
jgi:hypothetical protein